jgi:hypothetical protein
LRSSNPVVFWDWGRASARPLEVYYAAFFVVGLKDPSHFHSSAAIATQKFQSAQRGYVEWRSVPPHSRHENVTVALPGEKVIPTAAQSSTRSSARNSLSKCVQAIENNLLLMFPLYALHKG